jgi:oligoribonuclease
MSNVIDPTITDRLVWIDCEMTGLNPRVDALIEVACVVTDAELNRLDDGLDILITPPVEALAQMGDFVRNMHTRSGLLNEISKEGVSLESATDAVVKYVRSHVPNGGSAPLAGNSIGTDKAFLVEYMPQLIDHLHYRVVDVSTIKELARRWYPRVLELAPVKQEGHRALADINESIEELRYYRQAMFV